MHKLIKTLIVCCIPSFFPTSTWGQKLDLLRQKGMYQWNIKAANYSGITPIGNNTYAVVSDKEPLDGFYLFTIMQNNKTGEVEYIKADSLKGVTPVSTDTANISKSDLEDVAYLPSTNTLFICSEHQQSIEEYTLEGQKTGRNLNIPTLFQKDNIYGNLGFEALTFDAHRNVFWTTTEATLKSDGPAATASTLEAQNVLRLQSFDTNLQPQKQYAYRMDRGKAKDGGRSYTIGVPAICALPDGRLFVLEREVRISPNYMSSHVECKLFEVNPATSIPITPDIPLPEVDHNDFMIKKLVANFTTRLSGVSYNLANYEGMCLGQVLDDGTQTLLLINDSQGGAGNHGFRIKDYIKVILLRKE